MKTIRFDLTSVEQSIDARKAQPGELVEAVNVRRLSEGPGPLEKRLGLDRTNTTTFNHASIAFTGPINAVEAGDSALLVRDSADVLWDRDPESGLGLYRGTYPRAFPRVRGAETIPIRGRLNKPVIVLRGSDIWVLCINNLNSSQTAWNGYQISVFDATTGLRKWPIASVAATNIAMLTAAVDGSNNVWVFWGKYGSNENVINVHKFTGNPTGTPSTTTFVTMGGSDSIKALDAKYLSSVNEIAVVAVALQVAAQNVIRHYHGYLDTATGAAKASPAGVTDAHSGGTGSPQTACANGVSLAEGVTGGNGFFYYSYLREHNATSNEVDVMRVKVNATTLAINDETIVRTYTGLDGSIGQTLGTTVGFLDGSTETYFSSVWQVNAGSADTGVLNVDTWGDAYNGSVTPVFFNLSAWVAGKPFKFGTKWYVLLGVDDGSAQHAQRQFILYRSDGYLVSPALQGEADAIFHGGGRATGPGAATQVNWFLHQSTHIVAPVQITASRFAYAVMRDISSADNPDPCVLDFDMDADYYSTAPNIVPGGVPVVAGGADSARELAPIAFPARDMTFTTLGSGEVRSVNRVSYRYRISRSDGTLIRSQHRSIQSINFLNNANTNRWVCNLPSLPYTNGEVSIELLGSVCGSTAVDLFIQQVVRNDPVTRFVSFNIFPMNWSATSESLDQAVGTLSPQPLPPARLAAPFKGYLILGGCPDDEIWVSFPARPGRFPEFNPALVIEGKRGTGELQAMASVDGETFALAWRDAIVLMTGDGPDGIGGGQFALRKLPGRYGCINPFAFIQGPAGIYFPRASDGRMCCLTAGGVAEIYRGMEAYRGFEWTGAVDDVTNREIRWTAANGKILRLDYGHPTEKQPFGQWYLDESSAFPAWIGVRAINDGVLAHVEAGTVNTLRHWQAGTGFTDNGTEIAKRIGLTTIQAADALGEFDVARVQISGGPASATNASTYRYTVNTVDGGDETHDDAANPEQDVEFEPFLYRERQMTISINEITPSGRGRKFDSVAIDVNEYDRLQTPKRRVP